MNWLIKRLGAAIIAGIGWKLGADAYEAIKERIQKQKEKEKTEEEKEDGAEAGAATDAAEQGPARRGRDR